MERISLPRNFEPTYPSYDEDDANANQDKRDWYQGLVGGDMKLALISFVAAIPIVALFYIDHLVSCILGQKKELGLRKG